MKSLLSKFLLSGAFFICSVGYGQQFRIIPDCADTLPTGNFQYSIQGQATFTDSMSVYVEIRSNDSLATVVYSGTIDFLHPVNTTLTTYSIDPVLQTFSIDLIELPTTNYYIYLRSAVLGEIKEEILIPTFVII